MRRQLARQLTTKLVVNRRAPSTFSAESAVAPPPQLLPPSHDERRLARRQKHKRRMGKPDRDDSGSASGDDRAGVSASRRGRLPALVRSLSKDIDLDEQQRRAEEEEGEQAEPDEENTDAMQSDVSEDAVALPPVRILGIGKTTSEGDTGHVNEDRMVVQSSGKFHLFAVIDGHGGSKAAEFLVAHLFKTLEDVYKKSGFESKKELEQAIDDLDRTFLKISACQQDDSGACFNAVVLYWSKAEQSHQRMVLNCGDCRAIAREAPEKRDKRRVQPGRSSSWHCQDTRTKVPVLSLSEDHSISNRAEKLRVLEAGAFIRNKRIAGVLEPFRSIGDLDMKGKSMQGWVIPTPEIRESELLVGRTTIVLATDGVWSVMSNQRAMIVAQQELVDGGDEQTAAEAIADEAREIGSSDDITVVVVSM